MSISADPIKVAIDEALKRHGMVAELLNGDMDPLSIAVGCADAARLCGSHQPGLVARFLMAAEVIRRLRFAEVAAQINHDTILEMTK